MRLVKGLIGLSAYRLIDLSLSSHLIGLEYGPTRVVYVSPIRDIIDFRVPNLSLQNTHLINSFNGFFDFSHSVLFLCRNIDILYWLPLFLSILTKSLKYLILNKIGYLKYLINDWFFFFN